VNVPRAVRVHAHNSQGYGLPQSSSPTFGHPYIEPSPPTNVRVGVTSDTMLTVAFDLPSDNGGDNVTKFKVCTPKLCRCTRSISSKYLHMNTVWFLRGGGGSEVTAPMAEVFILSLLPKANVSCGRSIRLLLTSRSSSLHDRPGHVHGVD
jgi:hypothetical protein